MYNYRLEIMEKIICIYLLLNKNIIEVTSSNIFSGRDIIDQIENLDSLKLIN